MAAARTPAARRTTRPAGTGLPTQIRGLAEGHDVHVKFGLFGDPGSGKTPFLSTSPNCLILEADRGIESALKVAPSTTKKWVVDDWNDLNEAYNWLKNENASQQTPFEWAWFDGITLFQDRGLAQIMEDLHAVKSHRSIYAPDQGEYRQNMERLKKFIRDFVALPINIGWTAHVMVVERTFADGTTVETNMPAIQGKDMSSKISGHMNIVAHMEVRESKKNPGTELNVLTTSRKDNWYGRDRYGAIGTMVKPTMTQVLEKITAARATPVKKAAAATTGRTK